VLLHNSLEGGFEFLPPIYFVNMDTETQKVKKKKKVPEIMWSGVAKSSGEMTPLCRSVWQCCLGWPAGSLLLLVPISDMP
jgi:hypothetical protein